MTQKSAKENAIKLAKQISKTRQNYECEKCDKTLARGWQMHGAHIMPVTWAKTAAMPENILCLCASCHSMGSNSQHQDPIPFSRWFDAKWPGRYDELSKAQEDRVLDTLIIMGVVDEAYRLYFIKPLRRLGGATMLAYANKALKFGKNPQRYFTALCNKSY